ncbi:hypothetical protein PR048_004241 [Dryococelus australis]|uniref:Uncharacterized protein n=1 Tax=Dryococelus australis TaxID=614101 RepID=A0ABQ9I5E5_9NEOP|nr:hypothetical protein PR048_004241 [Dryococelus australis]
MTWTPKPLHSLQTAVAGKIKHYSRRIASLPYEIEHAGDIFIPSQLIPIFRLAGRKKPYVVHDMQPTDFLDFKQFSKYMCMHSVKSFRGNNSGRKLKN